MGARRLENWLDGYLAYTANQEATEKLHFWVGVSVISGALKRQVWMRRVRYTLYPNIYILIVAESATARKSVAMDLGMQLIRDAVPDVFYLSGSMTPEGLVKYMNRQKTMIKDTQNGRKVDIQYDSHIMLHADELAEAFGFDRSRASKFTILLTKIYGSQREHTHTIASEDQIILRNLYPVFLAGTDPVNLKVLPEEAVNGLIGRIIFVTEDHVKQLIAWESPEAAEAADRLYPLLKEDLNSISQLHGEIVPSPEARQYFEDWYNTIGTSRYEDRRTDSFRARCHDTGIKIAMILSIAESDSLIVELDHMKRGIELIEKQIPEFSRVADWSKVSNYAQQRAQFIELLKRQEGKGVRAQHMKTLNFSLEEITNIENSLEQEHTIEMRILDKNVYYKLLRFE